jgi:hypothetical protein
MNRWFPDSLVQTSAPLMRLPEGRKEMVPVSAKKRLPFPHFGAAIYRSPGKFKCRVKPSFKPNIFSGLYSLCFNLGY